MQFIEPEKRKIESAFRIDIPKFMATLNECNYLGTKVFAGLDFYTFRNGLVMLYILLKQTNVIIWAAQRQKPSLNGTIHTGLELAEIKYFNSR